MTENKTLISISNQLSSEFRINRAFSILKSNFRKAFDGGLDPAIYLLSADCGTGKSTVVQAFLRDWKIKGFPGGGGVIIFVGTLAEVDAYKDGAALDREDYAIYSPDPIYKTHGAGIDAAGDVPILFVTHAMARKRLSGLPSFDDAIEFRYRGKPRTLRIWDESFLPVEYASFELNDLKALPAALRGRPQSDINAIDALIPDRGERIIGGVINIPATIREIADGGFKAKANLPERAKLALEGLSKVAGARLYSSGSDEQGWRLTGIGLPMPADIGPLFVLDASARLTRRYDDWSAYGMPVVHLEPAAIQYEPLTLYCWDRGCGQTALAKEDERWTVFQAIADLTNSKPGEEFLLVMAKRFAAFDKEGVPIIPDDLRAMIADPSKVHVTTWGRHLGSNDHRDVGNVILLGSYNYGDGAYDAISLAATGIGNGVVSSDMRRATEGREFMHNVYQAVCRIRVRQRVGGQCSRANAYLIMTDGQRRRDLIRQAFPGCSIQAWTPVRARKKRKADHVLDVLFKLMETRTIVAFKEVADACGANDRSYLTKILKDERFKEALDRNGIQISARCFICQRTIKEAA